MHFQEWIENSIRQKKNTSRCCYFYISLPHAEIDKPAKWVKKVYRSIIGLKSMSLFPFADKPLLIHDWKDWKMSKLILQSYRQMLPQLRWWFTVLREISIKINHSHLCKRLTLTENSAIMQLISIIIKLSRLFNRLQIPNLNHTFLLHATYRDARWTATAKSPEKYFLSFNSFNNNCRIYILLMHCSLRAKKIYFICPAHEITHRKLLYLR